MTSSVAGTERAAVATHEKISRSSIVPALLVIGVALLSNLNVLSAGFVWDDNALILGNNVIKHWNTLPSVFTQTFLASYYRPVVMLSFAAEYAIWGLRPFGFHLTNLLLHAINSIFVFMILKRVSGNAGAAFFGALLFASHPVHKGVVVIADRTGMLSAFFFLGALLLYLGYRESESRRSAWGKYAASVVLCGLAIFSKEEALTLPLIIVMTDLFLFPEEVKRNWRSSPALYVPFFALPVFYLLIRAWVAASTGEMARAFTTELARRLLTIPEILFNYVFLLLGPLRLDFDPRTPLIEFGQRAWIFTLALAVLVAAIPWLVRRAKPIAFGMLWFLIVFVPMSNIIPIFPAVAARELFTPIHFLYLPSVGIFLCAGYILSGMLTEFETARFGSVCRKGTILGVILLVVFFGALSYRRNTRWKNEIALYEYMVGMHPKEARGRANLAHAYLNEGRKVDAVRQLELAVALDPGSANDHNELGVAYLQIGLTRKATEEFGKSVQLEPNFADAYGNMAVAYAQEGLLDQAIAAGEKAVELSPSNSHKTNLGLIYMRVGRLDEARKQFESALASDPEDAAARSALAGLAQP